MKVFYTEPFYSLSGGMILVAANTPEEALHIAAMTEETSKAILDDWYEWSQFQELSGLSFDGDPQVIHYNFYAE